MSRLYSSGLAAENFPLFVCVSVVGLEKGFIFVDVIAHCSPRVL